MVAATLGAAIAALAARAGSVPDGSPAPRDTAAFQREGWIRSAAAGATARAAELYLAFLSAAIGASLLAYIPSVVRTVQPNAVLFPMAELAVVFVAGLVALPFAASDGSADRSRRGVAALAVVAFGTIALIAAVPPYLPGGLGLLVGAVTGVVGATVIALGGGTGGPFPTQSVGVGSAVVRRAVPLIVLAALVVLAFRLSNGTTLSAAAATDPSLGAYGIGLASVAMSGSLGGLVALDLGGRFSASLADAGRALPLGSTPNSPIAPSGGSTDREPGFTCGVRSAALIATGLSSIVFVAGLLYLLPVEIGLAPGALAVAAEFTHPGFVVGIAIGVLILLLSAGRGFAPSPTERAGRFAAPLVLGVGAPILAGWALGAAGMLGVATGALLGGLGLGLVDDMIPAGPTTSGGEVPILPTVALTIVATLAFSGALLAGSFAGVL